jgi:hypothetical protein
VLSHPECAVLFDPLFATRKEGKKNKNPFFSQSEEKVVERSNDRMSQLCGMHLITN